MTPNVVGATPFLSTHGVHLLTLAGPAVTFAVFAAAADLRSRLRRGRRAPFKPHRGLTSAAGGFGVVAAAVHGGVAPEHFREAAVFGVFFVVTGVCQLAWSLLMLARPRASAVVAGAVGNAGVVALWIYTRVVAVPLGPGAGRAEEIGVADIVATAAELGIVLLAVWVAVEARSSRVVGTGPDRLVPAPHGS